jgi:hypothetical protein
LRAQQFGVSVEGARYPVGRVDHFWSNVVHFSTPKCGSNYYIVLYIMELLNGTHFEIINFNIYVMKLIGMQNI